MLPILANNKINLEIYGLKGERVNYLKQLLVNNSLPNYIIDNENNLFPSTLSNKEGS